MLRHQWPRGQWHWVSPDTFSRAIKGHLNFGNRASGFGDRRGTLNSPPPVSCYEKYPSQARVNLYRHALTQVFLNIRVHMTAVRTRANYFAECDVTLVWRHSAVDGRASRPNGHGKNILCDLRPDQWKAIARVMEGATSQTVGKRELYCI